jgi:hypothetical protein
MRQFYLQWKISQTLSADSKTERSQEISQTPSAKLKSQDAPAFPLSWSHYVRLLSVADLKARQHYESEALRGGWSVRQLDRQIPTLSYQRGNHLNLSTSDVDALANFFHRIFDFRMVYKRGAGNFAIMTSENGLVLTLMKDKTLREQGYPVGFHVEFL